MFNLKGIILIGTVLLGVGIVNASDIYIDDNNPIPGDQISKIEINPSTGNIFVTTVSGYVVTPGDVTPPPPDAVAITSFSAAPLSILEGEAVTLAWTTQNATSCTMGHTVGGWSPTIGVSSTGTVVTISTKGSYQFTLTCSDSAGNTDSAVRNVTVSAPVVVGENCSDFNSPINGEVLEWQPFWGVEFPGPTSGDKTMFVNRYGYVALKFNTGNTDDSGAFSTVESTLTSGSRLGSISSCPGDFDVKPECDQVWGAGLSLVWSTEGYKGACQLEKNTTYYFNITFTNGEDPSVTACTDKYCQARIRFYNP